MNKLRAKTLMAESRARQDRGSLLLAVTLAVREPADVTATGVRQRTVVTVVPDRPWWRTLGFHTHRMHRRAWKAARGRAAGVRVAGLDSAYLLWAVVCSAALVSAIYWGSR